MPGNCSYRCNCRSKIHREGCALYVNPNASEIQRLRARVTELEAKVVGVGADALRELAEARRAPELIAAFFDALHPDAAVEDCEVPGCTIPFSSCEPHQIAALVRGEGWRPK